MIYICMPYRGKNGDDATPDEIKANILTAVSVANDIVKQFPSLEPYCPHACPELEPMNDQWREGLISTDDIMLKCIEKLNTCESILIIGEMTEGMQLEHDEAVREGIDIYMYPEWNYDTKKQFAHDWLSGR